VRNIGRLFPAFALVALLQACGGSTTDGNGAPGASIQVDDFPSAAAHALCDHFGDCCSQASLDFNESSCLATQIVDAQAKLDGRGKRRYVPTAAAACIADLKQVAKLCAVPVKEGPDCGWKLLIGTIATGGACTESDECAPPAVCTDSVCVATPFAKRGGKCVATCLGGDQSQVTSCYGATATSGPVCSSDDGLMCGDDGTCQPLPDLDGAGAAGDACTSASPCEQDFYCDDTSDQCAAQKPPFASCAADEECGDPQTCMNGQCVFGLGAVCSGMTEPAN
jgi:hypothetical protein